MGDRTKIADALMCPLGGTLPPDSVPRGHYWDGGFYHCPCGAIVEWVSDDRVAEHQDARVAAALPVLDAAGYDVVLRADPDTSDELFTEARRLLDAATPGPWEQWEAYEVRSFGPTLIASTNGRTDNSQAVADAELIAAAPRLIAALLERAVTAEADRDEAERRERTAVNLANYHRGVAREAGRRADAARPPAPTESTPDPPYQPVAGRPTMDLLDRGTDR